MKSQDFQLAFVDAKLPDIEGLELAEEIRSMDNKVVLIMVSGYFYKDDAAIKAALRQGNINGFVSKPFLHEEIEGIIRNQFFRSAAGDME